MVIIFTLQLLKIGRLTNKYKARSCLLIIKNLTITPKLQKYLDYLNYKLWLIIGSKRFI